MKGIPTKTAVLLDRESCLNKAAYDEPLFILRANDPVAAQIIRLWAAAAVGSHESGKLDHALNVADAFDAWRQKREPVPLPSSPMPLVAGAASPALTKHHELMAQSMRRT